ncbi:thiamine phosphate synthase [Sharpea azabuensis]|uniref:thiamine phosphate synthase n=1 Tax=Sharpea azabuensis TaxID=322505 RepID=UPI0015689833|nr:thiamine phosphate synthase [Sharpea azabuensis]
MNGVKEALMLYGVTDRHWLKNKSLHDAVEEAIQGGTTFIQLREKDDMALSHDAFLQEAIDIQALCKAYHVPFVIDDDVALAKEINADGVHVGQSDMEAGNVRALLGPNKIIGVSAETVEEAIAAEKCGASYLGVGAIFPTGSKADAKNVSMDTLHAICEAVHIPVIAIGGISKSNVHQLKHSGIVGIAVISAIFAQNDIKQACIELKEETRKMLYD